MKLSELNSDTVYTYRLGRHNGNSIKWEKWQQGKMIVERRKTAMPKHRNPNKGDIICLYSECGYSAQYEQHDYCEKYNTFSCEDYMMQIEGSTLD